MESCGRRVFHWDNDVCDYRVTVPEFHNGVTAIFNLKGLTSRMHHENQGEKRGNPG